MVVDDLIKSPGSWLTMGRDSAIAVSSRVRLARNIRTCAFPGWAGDRESAEVCSRVREAGSLLPEMGSPLFLNMAGITDVDKKVLQERRLVSSELCDKSAGSGLMVSADEHISIMINEEDHIRIQAVTPGLDLQTAWSRVSAADSGLERRIDYAFSRTLGYLTACPSNVGTGLRAGVMLHLAGLKLTEDLDSVIRGLSVLGFEIRGLFGEGTDAWGNMYQISNRSTLGDSEENILKNLTDVAEELIGHERDARLRLLEARSRAVRDHVARAFGIVRHCEMLSSREAIEFLSILRFGAEMGMLKEISPGRINRIMLLTQAGHLQKIAGKVIEAGERDAMRARLVRDRLGNMKFY
ncbi:MAG: protein arginine kinase [Kiritimatiellia bacterium]